jgi:hypothetical protein
MSGNRSTYLLSGAPYPQNNSINSPPLLPPERVGVAATFPAVQPLLFCNNAAEI